MDSKVIFAFGLGALAGAAGTYFALKGKYEKEYQEYRNDLLHIYGKPTDEDESAEGQTEDIHAEELVTRINSLVGGDKMENTQAVRYSEMYGNSDDKTYSKENDAKQKESILESNDFPVEDDLPYIIDEDEYASPYPANDKVTLKYFIKDDILIDELSHEPAEISTISEKNLQVMIDKDLDYIYVRNEANGTDYEVEKSEEDYEEAERAYLGIV